MSFSAGLYGGAADTNPPDQDRRSSRARPGTRCFHPHDDVRLPKCRSFRGFAAGVTIVDCRASAPIPENAPGVASGECCQALDFPLRKDRPVGGYYAGEDKKSVVPTTRNFSLPERALMRRCTARPMSARPATTRASEASPSTGPRQRSGRTRKRNLIGDSDEQAGGRDGIFKVKAAGYATLHQAVERGRGPRTIAPAKGARRVLEKWCSICLTASRISTTALKTENNPSPIRRILPTQEFGTARRPHPKKLVMLAAGTRLRVMPADARKLDAGAALLPLPCPATPPRSAGTEAAASANEPPAGIFDPASARPFLPASTTRVSRQFAGETLDRQARGSDCWLVNIRLGKPGGKIRHRPGRYDGSRWTALGRF